jgi:TRAP-type C4-dicarboxylate transport system substrate-binding protein
LPLSCRAPRPAKYRIKGTAGIATKGKEYAMRKFVLLAAALTALGMPGAGARAQDVTLKVHHFLPPGAPAQKDFIQPWTERVTKASGGKIKFQIYPSMQLGGGPPGLFDQARDGVADIVWTLPSYTAGRFPLVEVFELPFMTRSASATAPAVQEFAEKHLKDEFKEVQPLVFHSHAPGLFHVKAKPIIYFSDLQGLKIRAPTRTINDALKALGASPVGMPVPQLPQALSTGVVDGAVIPFEVAAALKIQELVKFHTVVPNFYTSVFIFAMNKKKYDGLPADLKKVMDANTGLGLAKELGRTWDNAEKPGLEAAQKAGNRFNTMDGSELARAQAAVQPVYDNWLKAAAAKGADGKKLLDEAKALIAKYGKTS